MPVLIDDQYLAVDPKELRHYCAEQGLPMQPFLGRANKYSTSVGPSPGRGWILVTQSVLNLLDPNEYHSLTFINPPPGAPAQQRAGNLVIIPDPLSITPGLDGDPGEVFLVQFADLRWLPKNPYYQCSISAQYNVMAPDAGYTTAGSGPGQTYYVNTSDTVTVPHPWQYVLDDIWNNQIAILDMGDSPQLPYADTTLAAGISAGSSIVTSVNDASNVDVGDYVTLSIGLPSCETAMVTAVDPVGDTITLDTLANAHLIGDTLTGPAGYPVNYSFPGACAWDVYNAILERCGCALAQNLNIDDENPVAFSIVRLGWRDDADYQLFQSRLDAAAAAAAGLLQYTARPPSTIVASVVPGNVQVYFHKVFIDHGNEDTTNWDSTQWITQSTYTHDVTVGTVGSIAYPDIVAGALDDTFHRLWDESPAMVDETSTVVNSAELDIRAKARASLYYRRMNAGTSMHNSYIGILDDTGGTPALPTGVYLTVLSRFVMGLSVYDYGLPHKGGEGKMMTDIVRSPGMIAAYEGGWADVPPLETLQPADFGRATTPNYPDTVQSILVGTVTSNAAVFNGTVQRPNPSTLVAGTAEACYIFDLNGGTFTTGAYVSGRLVGPSAISGTTRPTYSLISGGGSGGGGAVTNIWARAVIPSQSVPSGSRVYLTMTLSGGAESVVGIFGSSVVGDGGGMYGDAPVGSNYLVVQQGLAGSAIVLPGVGGAWIEWDSGSTGNVLLELPIGPAAFSGPPAFAPGVSQKSIGSDRQSVSFNFDVTTGFYVAVTQNSGSTRTVSGYAWIETAAIAPGENTNNQITAVLNNDATFFTNTLTSIVDLIVPLNAGKYAGRLDIWVQNSTAAEGVQFDFGGGSAIITNFLAGAGIFASGSPTFTQVNTISFAIGTVLNWSTITGYVNIVFDFSLTCATNGTFAFRIAENSPHTSGTVTVKAGANIRIDPLT